MKCPKCGTESVAGDTFCRACGLSLPPQCTTQSVQRYCRSCGAVILSDDVFCPSCGASVTAGEVRKSASNFVRVVEKRTPVVTPRQYANDQASRSQDTSATGYSRASFGLSIVALLAVFFVGGIVCYGMIQNNGQGFAGNSQNGNAVVTPNQYIVEDTDSSVSTESDDLPPSDVDSELNVSDAKTGPTNPYGVGGSYEVDSDGLVINKTYMFKFQIPAGYKGEMLTDRTILFRGKDFKVTIDAWFNDGETQESRYKNASSSLVSIDYETKSEGLFVVSGRDSRGHDMYTKEIVGTDYICRMVVDSEISPCSTACEQATIDFEGGFRLLK